MSPDGYFDPLIESRKFAQSRPRTVEEFILFFHEFWIVNF